MLVSSVDEESAAADAGLQAGDVITSVDGRSVADSANLRRCLSAVDPAEEVSIGETRAGREVELTATLNEGRARRRRLEIFGNAGRSILRAPQETGGRRSRKASPHSPVTC